MSTALVRRASERAEEARVLDARESRSKVRQELARNMSGRSLVELILDVPRGSASNDDSESLFLDGLQRLEKELGVAPADLREDSAGYYGLFVTQLPVLLMRRRASRLEEQPSWDAHMSIECYGLAGNLGTTGRVPRSAVGAPSRR
jgi:hypothetical protein